MQSPTKVFVEKHKVQVAKVLVAAKPLHCLSLALQPRTQSCSYQREHHCSFLLCRCHAAFLQPLSSILTAIQPHAHSVQHLQGLYIQSSADLNGEKPLQLAQLLLLL